MSFHLLAYAAQGDLGAGVATFKPLMSYGATGGDGIMNQRAGTDYMRSSEPAKILGAYAGGDTLARARIYTSAQQPCNIRPLNNTVAPPSNPGVADWLDNAIEVAAARDLIVDGWATAGTHSAVVVAFLAQRLRPPPTGEVICISGQVSDAGVANWQWREPLSMTWQTLAPGRYAVIGSECISPTNTIAHRWVFDDSRFRPGGLCHAAGSDVPHRFNLGGTLGTWGEFTAPVMPRLEILTYAAQASHTVYLHLVRVN